MLFVFMCNIGSMLSLGDVIRHTFACPHHTVELISSRILILALTINEQHLFAMKELPSLEERKSVLWEDLFFLQSVQKHDGSMLLLLLVILHDSFLFLVDINDGSKLLHLNPCRSCSGKVSLKKHRKRSRVTCSWL